MEEHSPLPHLLLAIASLLALLLFVIRSGSRSRSNNNDDKPGLPPEVPGSWPIIGHLHLLRDPIPLARTLASMADRHGPIFLIRLGVHPAVVISTHELVRECFTTHDRALASRPRSRNGIHMGYNYAAFGFTRYGPYWREMRRLTMVELLGHRRLRALKHVQVSEIDALIRGLYYSVVPNNTPVTISKRFEHMSLNIITRMIASKRYFGSRVDGSEAAHVRRVIKEFMEISGFPAISDLIPYMGWTDFFGTVKAMKSIARDLDAIIGNWIKEHEDIIKDHMDFIDVMISVIKDNSMLGYSKETIIKATVSNIIVAGSDTTSLNLTWVVSLLLNHNLSLAKAHDELDHKIGRERWVRDSDIGNLPYLQAIVKETLRLYPPGPLSVPHEADEDCIVGGYFIPKGTRIFANLWKLHRDPRVWSEPDRFLPERFLLNGMDASGQHFEFIPFGSGRRACPGSSFALQVTHLALARLLQAFDIATPDNVPVDMTEGLAVTLPKEKPVEVLLKPRLPDKLFEELMIGNGSDLTI